MTESQQRRGIWWFTFRGGEVEGWGFQSAESGVRTPLIVATTVCALFLSARAGKLDCLLPCG